MTLDVIHRDRDQQWNRVTGSRPLTWLEQCVAIISGSNGIRCQERCLAEEAVIKQLTEM